MTKSEALVMLKSWQGMIDPLNEEHKLDKRFAALEVACIALANAIEEDKKSGGSSTTYKTRLGRLEAKVAEIEDRLGHLENESIDDKVLCGECIYWDCTQPLSGIGRCTNPLDDRWSIYTSKNWCGHGTRKGEE